MARPFQYRLGEVARNAPKRNLSNTGVTLVNPVNDCNNAPLKYMFRLVALVKDTAYEFHVLVVSGMTAWLVTALVLVLSIWIKLFLTYKVKN